MSQLHAKRKASGVESYNKKGTSMQETTPENGTEPLEVFKRQELSFHREHILSL